MVAPIDHNNSVIGILQHDGEEEDKNLRGPIAAICLKSLGGKRLELRSHRDMLGTSQLKCNNFAPTTHKLPQLFQICQQQIHGKETFRSGKQQYHRWPHRRFSHWASQVWKMPTAHLRSGHEYHLEPQSWRFSTAYSEAYRMLLWTCEWPWWPWSSLESPWNITGPHVMRFSQLADSWWRTDCKKWGSKRWVMRIIIWSSSLTFSAAGITFDLCAWFG